MSDAEPHDHNHTHTPYEQIDTTREMLVAEAFSVDCGELNASGDSRDGEHMTFVRFIGPVGKFGEGKTSDGDVVVALNRDFLAYFQAYFGQYLLIHNMAWMQQEAIVREAVEGNGPTSSGE